MQRSHEKRPESEISLSGGRITQGVVRVGETVRRPANLSSPFVAALLLHLEGSSFNGVPHYLGQDEKTRDIFSYVPGEIPIKFRRFKDDQVAEAGALMRAFHDATRGSQLAGHREVVCHHDAGPNNFVFQNGGPAVLIDFDLASPGDPLEDIGYMAWLWCISSKQDRQPAELQAAQVRILADGYGCSPLDRQQLFDAIIERQSWNVGSWNEYLHHPEPDVASPAEVTERIAWTREEQAFTLANRQMFEAALL